MRLPSRLRVLLVHKSTLPALTYGGTERVVWYLAKALKARGHEVGLMAGPGTRCDFASVLYIKKNVSLEAQLPKGYDLYHFHFPIDFAPQAPYVITLHGNAQPNEILDPNTVFVSKDHALRHGGSCFVYNGLDWSDSSTINLRNARSDLHFLGKAAWKIKNVKTAIRLAKEAGKRIHILGGYRLNFNMGFRFTWDWHARFHGMVGGRKKWELLQKSKALLFPVLWDEPFGLAIIESLYAGCRVIGSSYGSVPELIHSIEYGHHSVNYRDLLYAVKHLPDTPSLECHIYANDHFNADRMAENYETIYDRVLKGEILHREKLYLANNVGNYSIT